MYLWVGCEDKDSSMQWVLLLLMGWASVSAAQQCQDCPLPSRLKGADSAVYVLLAGRVRLEQCCSIVRTFLPGTNVQAVRIHFVREGMCRDTIVPIAAVVEAGTVGLGLDGQPRVIPILPVREYERRKRPPDPSASFIEGILLGGATAKDQSQRRIGSSPLFPGGEILIAPFGNLLGQRWSLGFLTGAYSDGTRWRIPVGGQMRYWFAPQGELYRQQRYVPDSCTFNEPTSVVLGDEYREQEVPYPRLDPSAAWVTDYVERGIGWQPFVFLEGGMLLNTGFDGAGQNPSLNPEEYGQWFFSAGAGTTAWDVLMIAVGYRYQRLNVRTPCAVCPPGSAAPDNYVVNTAVVHALMLKLGLHLRF